MRVIVNKDDELIKEYLNVRSKVIKACEHTEYFESYSKMIKHKGEYEYLLVYDEELTKTKLSSDAKYLFDIMITVEHDFVAYDDNSYRPDVKSFETAKERTDWYKDIDNNYYFVDLEEKEGTLEQNLGLTENYDDGDALFLKASTVYSDKIKVGILKYDE